MQHIYNKENIVKNNEIISTAQIYLLTSATMKLLRVPILHSGPNLTKVIGPGLHRLKHRACLLWCKRTEQASWYKRTEHTKTLPRTGNWLVHKPPRLELSLAKRRVI